jgi:hypothetical protein
MLRRLLVEGQYPNAWTTLGLPGEPYISATDLDAALGGVTRQYLQYALAPPAEQVGLLTVSALREGDVKSQLHGDQGHSAGLGDRASKSSTPIASEPRSS